MVPLLLLPSWTLLCSIFPPHMRAITNRKYLSDSRYFLQKCYQLFLKGSQEDVSNSFNQEGHRAQTPLPPLRGLKEYTQTAVPNKQPLDRRNSVDVSALITLTFPEKERMFYCGWKKEKKHPDQTPTSFFPGLCFCYGDWQNTQQGLT